MQHSIFIQSQNDFLSSHPKILIRIYTLQVPMKFMKHEIFTN